MPRLTGAEASRGATQRSGTFEWQVRSSGHFDIYYYPALVPDLERVEAAAERAYQRVSAALGHELAFRIPLVLFRTREDFEQQSIVPGVNLAQVRSFAEPERNRVVLLFDEVTEALDQVVIHEITHVFMFDILPGSPIRRVLPKWLPEGLAEYMTGVWDPADLTMVREFVTTNGVPSITGVVARYNQYAYANQRAGLKLGRLVFDFIEARWGEQGVRQFVRALRQDVGTNRSYQTAFDMTPQEFDGAFARYLNERL